MNPSTRLLPFGRANSIHFFQKYRRVSSSTKTTHPRDPAKSSHFRRKMAQHKREKPKQAGRPAQPASLTHRVHFGVSNFPAKLWSSKYSPLFGVNGLAGPNKHTSQQKTNKTDWKVRQWKMSSFFVKKITPSLASSASSQWCNCTLGRDREPSWLASCSTGQALSHGVHGSECWTTHNLDCSCKSESRC